MNSISSYAHSTKLIIQSLNSSSSDIQENIASLTRNPNKLSVKYQNEKLLIEQNKLNTLTSIKNWINNIPKSERINSITPINNIAENLRNFILNNNTGQFIFKTNNLKQLPNISLDNLTQLDFSNCKELTSIGKLNVPNLTHLNISDTKIKNLYNLYMPNLEEFRATDCVELISLKALKLPKLKLFEVYNCDSLSLIEALHTPKLTYLDISKAKINSFRNFAQLPNLISLYINDTPINSFIGLDAPNLEVLGAENCTSITSLEELNSDNLYELRVGGTSINSFFGLKQSRYLFSIHAENCQNLTSLRELNNFTLVSLYLDNCINLTSVEGLNRNNLSLYAKNCNITHVPDSLLENSREYYTIDLRNNRLSTQEIQRTIGIARQNENLTILLDDDFGAITKITKCKEAILQWLLLDNNITSSTDIRKIWCQTLLSSKNLDKNLEKIANTLVQSLDENDESVLALLLTRLVNIKQFLKIDSKTNIQSIQNTIQTIQRHLIRASKDTKYKNQMINVAKDSIGTCDDNVARFLLNMHVIDLYENLKSQPTINKLVHFLKTQVINIYIAKMTKIHMDKKIPYTDDVEVYMAYYLICAKSIAKPPFEDMMFLECANLNQKDLDDGTRQIHNLCANDDFAGEFINYIDFSDINIQSIIGIVAPKLKKEYLEEMLRIQQLENKLDINEPNFNDELQRLYNLKIEAKKKLWLQLKKLSTND